MSRFAYVIVVGTVVVWVVMAAYDIWFWGDKPVNRGEPAPTRRLTLVNWIFLTVFISSVWLWFYYVDTRPEIPHPETGNIYELNNHGSIVYLTLADRIALWGTVVVGLGGGIAASRHRRGELVHADRAGVASGHSASSRRKHADGVRLA